MLPRTVGVFLMVLGVVLVMVFETAPGHEPQSARKPTLTVEQLIHRLDSDDYQTREQAARILEKRDEALPSLLKAMRKDSLEVRRHAAQIIKVLQTRRMLARVKGGQVDQFVDHMVAMPDRVDDAVWGAVVDLAEAIRMKVNKKHEKNVSQPEIGKVWRHLGGVTMPESIEEDHELFYRRTLAYQANKKHALNRSILICRGSIRCENGIGESIVFANGNVTVRQPGKPYQTCILNSIVFCDGSIETDNTGGSAILFATGSVTIHGHKNENIVVIQHAREALGLLHFFDTRQVGIEVKEEQDAESDTDPVVVQKVEKGKAFAAAGFREGDQVEAINGEKVTSCEQFRRAVRHAAMANADVTFTIRRLKHTMKLRVAFLD